MGNETVAAYRFGEFVLNLERGCLQRDGIDLELRPKAFEVLRYLVERAGKLASKDELVGIAWPNVTVSDDSLAQCVRDIRKVLDDDEQCFIRTVPRRGYVFVANVNMLGDTDKAAPMRSVGQVAIQRRFGMRRLHFGSFCIGLALPIVFLAAWIGLAELLLKPPKAATPTDTIFIGNKTVIGQTIAYPSGTPLLKAAVLFTEPGDKFDWHTHETPAFGYVLEGEITIDYGSKGIRVYHAGDGLLEALEWPHRASNRGATSARILAVYIGAEGTDFATPAAGPK